MSNIQRVCGDCLYFHSCESWQRFYNEILTEMGGATIDFSSDVNANNCQEFISASQYIKLPCNVGDTVYILSERKRNGKWQWVIVPKVVTCIRIEQLMIVIEYQGGSIPDGHDLLFYSEEEAKKAINKH